MRESPVAIEKIAVLRARPRARRVGSAGVSAGGSAEGVAGVSVSVDTSAL